MTNTVNSNSKEKCHPLPQGGTFLNLQMPAICWLRMVEIITFAIKT